MLNRPLLRKLERLKTRNTLLEGEKACQGKVFQERVFREGV